METLSILQIELNTKGHKSKPFFNMLHGLCYKLAGEGYPHQKNIPPVFHPIIRKWKPTKKETNVLLEIRSVSESFLNNVLQYLSQYDTLQIGKFTFHISTFHLKKKESINIQGEIPPIPSIFRLYFNSPTAFRINRSGELQGFTTIAYPDLPCLIRSMARTLHKILAYKAELDVLEGMANKISIVNSILKPYKAKLGKKIESIDSFVGYIDLDISALDEDEKQIFSMLVKISKYTGVGHKKGYGLGSISLAKTVN